jgi:DNA-binding transcriptional MocR family regulator
MTIWQPDLDRSKPLYLAIADSLSQDVAAGVLPEGTRLPPQRDLAWKLGVTLGTITRAYKEAENRGLLSGEVGRGSYVKRPRGVTALNVPASEDDGIIDLSHAVPPPIVKSSEFDAALQFIMRDPKKLSLLDYAPPEGFPLHRAMAVKWLKRSCIEAEESQVVISAGAHLGLITVLEALTNPGDHVAAERINYALLRTTFRNAHLTPVPMPMDADGLIPDALEAAAKQHPLRLLYIVPTLQNPTTHTMSRKRREEIVAVARKLDLTIIEDDIFRLLDERVQPPTFFELAPERTFHITSLSKTLAPGLRIGFVVSPKGQERLLRAHVRNMAARTVGLTGEIARYWIETDAASDILSRTLQETAVRRAQAIEILGSERFRCAPGAPFGWLELPEHWSGARFAQSLSAHKIKVTPGNAFDLAPSGPSRHIRITFGAPSSGQRARHGFETIAELLQEHEEDDYTPVA